MVDPERLAAFALMTGATSIVPGLSMLFVMAQTVQRGWRSGTAALVGMQVGYLGWWTLAALGLGALAQAFPLAFRMLAIGGALYLAWMGVRSIRHAGAAPASADDAGESSHRAFMSGVLVALGNPKSLVYIVALLPPFVDPASPVLPQLATFWLVGMTIDLAVGAAYILAGARLAGALERPRTRRRLDVAVGGVYLTIAAGVLIEMTRT